MTLYNCRHSGDEYRITKFDSLGNVESSYLCSFTECQCPAGVRPTCRHREMLPKFVQRGAVDSGWQLDYDRGGWVDMRTGDEEEPEALPGDVERDELMFIDEASAVTPEMWNAGLPTPAKWRRF